MLPTVLPTVLATVLAEVLATVLAELLAELLTEVLTEVLANPKEKWKIIKEKCCILKDYVRCYFYGQLETLIRRGMGLRFGKSKS